MEITSSCIKADIQKFAVKTEISQSDAYRHFIKAEALRLNNLFLESIEEYLISISHDSQNYEAFKGLGLAYRKAGLVKKSIEALYKAKHLSPFDKSIYNELGYSLVMENRPEAALKEFRKAIKLDPDYIEAQFNLAVGHEFINETDLAIKIYNKILEIRPSYISAYNNLGSLYIRIGQYRNAIEIFKAV